MNLIKKFILIIQSKNSIKRRFIPNGRENVLIIMQINEEEKD